jgi:hypothetical protein
VNLMIVPAKKVYRDTTQGKLIFIFMAFLIAMLIAGHIGFWPTFITSVIVLLLAWRVSYVCVKITRDDKIKVVNLLKTETFSWDEIDYFKIIQVGGSKVGGIKLKNGRESLITSTGVPATQPSRVNSYGDWDRVINELNSELEIRTGKIITPDLSCTLLPDGHKAGL